MFFLFEIQKKLLFFILIFFSVKAHASELDHSFMRTRKQIAVYREASRAQKPVGRIHFGAVLKVFQTDVKRGCRQGWVKLENGGYACSGDLVVDKEATSSSSAPLDDPDILKDVQRYIVNRGGAVSYMTRTDFLNNNRKFKLYGNSVLAVERTVFRRGLSYLVTREGLYVEKRNTQKMDPIWKLGVDGKYKPGGFVINENVKVRKKPAKEASIIKKLEKFTVINQGWSLSDKWLQLGEGGYVSKKDVALVRDVELDFTPEPFEKWISVDLQEQVLTAWEGTERRLVVPCSTGIKNNTEPGNYRIRWKRRLQTLRLFQGHLRVEDVQWVMYYIPQRGFAIHSAYHNRYGHRVSQGCVNVPRDDARWLYNWAAPISFPEYSENLDSEIEPGTRVIVF